ncbi:MULTISPECIES: sensor histidine kinase [unclassified Clostridium]|uniref:sensor histidine kinase n=1 Tax=unclassified Clostridium TaxID=2614128 RepID=UPI0025C5C76F|nr:MULTISPECIES: sensor histidine kinase [unclassified Clostridium]
MKETSLFYLLLSRFITYIGVFITSLVIMDKDINTLVMFSFLFIIILINSSFRVSKFIYKPSLFILSALVEILIVIYMQYGNNSIAFVYFYIINIDLYLLLELKQALYLSIPIYIGMFICLLPNTLEVILKDFILNSSIMIFMSSSASLMRIEIVMRQKIQGLYDELKKSRDELESANEKLTEYSKRVENIAVLNERNRLAGEIHDTIGHSLTALIMELDICDKLIDKDIGKTKTELNKATELARYSLSEVRRSVRAIKPSDSESLAGIHAIGELIKDFEKSSKIDIEFKVSRNQYKLSPTVEVTIYRAIQEALTNSAKHGKVDKVLIDLIFSSGKVILNIKDNGKGNGIFAKGVGLRTMEERVHSLGGQIKFLYDNGFTVYIEIPLED